MSLLVCAPTARELAALAPGIFPREDLLEEMRPMAAQLKGRDIIFLITGVGPINAAIASAFVLGLSLKDERQEIEGIILAGLAGAFQLDLTPLRSLWLVTEEIWPEYGLNDGARVTARAFSFPQWDGEKGKIYDRVPLDAAGSLFPALAEAPWPACRSLTVAGVSASFARRDVLWTAFHADLENMEGFSVAYAALRAGVPCIEVRSVSNKVGPRSREEKDFDGALKALGQILPTLDII